MKSTQQSLRANAQNFKKEKFNMPKNISSENAAELKPTAKRIYLFIPLLGVLIVLGAFLYYKGFIVAATVNGTPITRLSLIQQLEQQGGKTLLESLITEKVVANEAQKKNVTVSESEIDEEIKKLETAISQEGNSLDGELEKRGMSRADLRETMRNQKILEKLVMDKISVSDDEVTTYIADNKVQLPKDKENEEKESIKMYLKQQKFQQEAQVYIETLKKDSTVRYFVQY